MTLGNILFQAAEKDLAHNKKQGIEYIESVIDGKFTIKLVSAIYKDAEIECSLPDVGNDESQNYLRLYFLSMVYNAAIFGMKRMNHKKNKI